MTANAAVASPRRVRRVSRPEDARASSSITHPQSSTRVDVSDLAGAIGSVPAPSTLLSRYRSSLDLEFGASLRCRGVFFEWGQLGDGDGDGGYCSTDTVLRVPCAVFIRTPGRYVPYRSHTIHSHSGDR